MGRWRFDSQHLPALPPFILRRQPPGKLTITHWLTHSASHISKRSHIGPKQLWGFIDHFLDTNFGISMLLIQDVHLVTNVEYSWQKCDSGMPSIICSSVILRARPVRNVASSSSIGSSSNVTWTNTGVSNLTRATIANSRSGHEKSVDPFSLT